MIRFSVTVDSEILQRLATMGARAFPAGKAAFDASANLIQSQWQAWAMGGSLNGIPEISSPSANLARSIKIRKNSAFDVNIESESIQAQRIQEGTEELDMKTTHPFGNKSRVSKEGVPYLIVPFRWGTPNAQGGARAHFKNVIPQNMYSAVLAFKMETSRRKTVREDGSTAVHIEKNYRGQSIQRSEYDCGGRIKADGNVNGLVSFPDESKKRGSTYFPFRIISRDSPADSWIRKAVPPVDVTGALERTTRPVVEDMIRTGLEADLGV
ncbi:hypothetical protein [Treponema sp. R6D11]